MWWPSLDLPAFVLNHPSASAKQPNDELLSVWRFKYEYSLFASLLSFNYAAKLTTL